MRWITFSTVTLPEGEPSTPVGGAPTHAPTVKLPGGRYYAASELGAQAPVSLPYRQTYRGIIYGDTADELQTALDALKGLRGFEAALTREVQINPLAEEEPQQQWCSACLLQVTSTRESKNGLWLEVQLEFEIRSLWRGSLQEHVYIMGYGVNTLLVTNLGNCDVAEVELTLTAGEAITQFDLTSGVEVAWRYTGAVAAGKAVIIDTGQQAVHNNDGVADYAHFALLDAHTVEDWLLLHPGANYLTVTLLGGVYGAGDHSLKFSYYDAWQ
jgi:hypothetical protein